jgi:tetratricopeptide (TPR) repeat protein
MDGEMKSRLKIFLICLLWGALLSPKAYSETSQNGALTGHLAKKVSGKKTAKGKAAPEESSDDDIVLDEEPPADANTDKAEEYVNSGKYEQAVLMLKPKVDSLSRKGLMLLARAYAGQKDFLSEIRTLELCRAKSPRDYIVLTALGEAYLHVSRNDDAVGIFQEARDVNKKYRPAYDGLVRVLEKTAQTYEARIVVTDMLKIFGSGPALDSALCRLYAVDGFIEKSVESCKAAIESDPKNPENHIYLASSLKDQEDGNKATEILKKAAGRFPASEHIQSAAGSLATEKKDYISAYQYYKKASADDPKSVRALLGLANSSFKLQKNEESLGAFVKACELDRHNAARDFSGAIGELRTRKDLNWQSRFQNAMSICGQ